MDPDERLQQATELFTRYGAESVGLREDGMLVVKGSIDVRAMGLDELPFKHLGSYEVLGAFECTGNRLTSLEGSPSRTGEDFWLLWKPADEPGWGAFGSGKLFLVRQKPADEPAWGSAIRAWAIPVQRQSADDLARRSKNGGQGFPLQ